MGKDVLKWLSFGSAFFSLFVEGGICPPDTSLQYRSCHQREEGMVLQSVQNVECLDMKEVQNVQRKDPVLVVHVPQAGFGRTTVCAVRIVCKR